MVTQQARAVTIKKTFSRETIVSIEINAKPEVIWLLLTDAARYPTWNSTIISIEGMIEPGTKISLRSTLDPKRTFKLKIKEYIPNEKLVWGDGKGKRTFSLTKSTSDTTKFIMNEKIGGVMFPLYAKLIPPFNESFKAFAVDLKTEAEKIQNF